jgi:hypothetical protein
MLLQSKAVPLGLPLLRIRKQATRRERRDGISVEILTHGGRSNLMWRKFAKRKSDFSNQYGA